ncbi:MAG: hypothetical protein FJW31_20595 [Acidobacteria bacterium]|nr:hypothetical protein [Acidobacteriota bacterium]
MEFERGPINYSQPPDRDPIARLQAKIDAGEKRLAWSTDGRGYLRSLLEALAVPVSSQSLVFSKTSLQLHKIAPEAPRALYFNDDVYIGFVQRGDVLEISSVDPERGGMFYTLEQRPVEKPRIRRQDDCLQCHASGRTLGVPGHIVRSVHVDNEGQPMFTGGGGNPDHRTPFAERFGGWYVTGNHGAQRHLGNVYVKDRAQPDKVDTEAGANADTLDRFGVDTRPYLTPHSDLVAQLVLQHQVRMHNLIARVNFETKVALEAQRAMDKVLGKQPGGGWTDSTKRRIFGPAETLVRYMLFADEAPLRGPVSGTSPFSGEFAQLGPRDRRGRSLREFDLQRRLFKYPTSFLVYSEAFDALPEPAKDYVWRRLWEVLSGKEQRKEFAALSAADRQAVHNILIDTRRDLPAYWRTAR